LASLKSDKSRWFFQFMQHLYHLLLIVSRTFEYFITSENSFERIVRIQNFWFIFAILTKHIGGKTTEKLTNSLHDLVGKTRKNSRETSQKPGGKVPSFIKVFPKEAVRK
jgi:hypothetical protein